MRIPPSRDPRQLMNVLEALARLVPMPTMAAETLVDLEGRELAYGTTVVMVTAVASQEPGRPAAATASAPATSPACC